MRRRPCTAAGLQPAGLVSSFPHAAAAPGPHLAHSTCATTRSWAQQLVRACPRAVHAAGRTSVGITTSSSGWRTPARRATWHAGSRQPAPQQGRIRPAQEARARPPKCKQRRSHAGAARCATGATRTAPPHLQAAQQQRQRAVCQQGLQPLLRLRDERARVVLAQRVVRYDRAVYAVKGMRPRAAACIAAACRRAKRLAPGARARTPWHG